MPALSATLIHVIDTAHDPRRRSLFVIVGFATLIVGGGWALLGNTANAGSQVTPLYPEVQSTVPMVDMSELSVAQILSQEAILSRFYMLAYNGGVLNGLSGTGPYTVLAPANNYFDYVPKGKYVGLTRTQESELAQHHIIPTSAVQISENEGGTYLTLAGDMINFKPRDSDQSATVGDGFVIRGLIAKNGVVYVINKVLVPEDLTDALSP